MEAGLTQKQAAELIGYSYRSWQEWEGGRRKMKKVLFDSFLRYMEQLRHEKS